ncbi:MAG: hypothetical protein OEW41_08710, partial [Actinomycetota bacterium]|nr:hypothetical protein [Actinomycetota bacterium]
MLVAVVAWQWTVAPVEQAAAVDNCQKVIPYESWVGGAVTAAKDGVMQTATGSGPMLGFVSAPTGPLVGSLSGLAAAVGGVSTAGAATTGHVAAGVGAFLAAFVGTCTFLDWATGTGKDVSTA